MSREAFGRANGDIGQNENARVERANAPKQECKFDLGCTYRYAVEGRENNHDHSCDLPDVHCFMPESNR